MPGYSYTSDEPLLAGYVFGLNGLLSDTVEPPLESGCWADMWPTPSNHTYL